VLSLAWCAPCLGAPCQLRSLAGQEHGRTIPLGAEQRGIMIADNNGLIDPPLRQTIAPERTSSTIPCLRIEEATVFDRPCRTQDASCRAVQKVVLGIVPETAQGQARPDRLRLQCVDAGLLESAVDLPV
jgi:hypothetical protein